MAISFPAKVFILTSQKAKLVVFERLFLVSLVYCFKLVNENLVTVSRHHKHVIWLFTQHDLVKVRIVLEQEILKHLHDRLIV